jgi:hypothetical protein
MLKRTSAGITGENGKYVHPVYKNMSETSAKAVDKVLIATGQVKNKGKASDIVTNTQELQESIKAMSRIKGSRTSNNQDNRPLYRGGGRLSGLGFSLGGTFGKQVK